jgi:hypothetical protein
MPKLRAYTDDPGFFIRAWISNAGNVTYQVKPMAEQVLTNAGYGHGDDIPWAVIKALKTVGFIHTGNGEAAKYTDQIDDFDPDGNMLRVDEKKAEMLIEELEVNTSADEGALDKVRSLLDVDGYSVTTQQEQESTDEPTLSEKLKTRIQEKVNSPTEGESLPFEAARFDSVTDPKIEMQTPGDYKLNIIFGVFTDRSPSFASIFVDIYFKTNIGITSIDVSLDWGKKYDGDAYMAEWRERSDVTTFLADLMPIVRSALEEENYPTGNEVDNIDVSIGVL